MFKFVYNLDRSLHSVRRLLLDEIKPVLLVKVMNVDKVISCLLFNVGYSHFTYKSNIFTISLDRNKYNYQVVNGVKVKVPFSYNGMVVVVDTLVKLGYLELDTGGMKFKYDHADKLKGGKGFVIDSIKYSTLTITPKMMELLPDKLLDNGFIKLDNVLVLRDKNKKDIEFISNKKLADKKKSLDGYNDAIRSTLIKGSGGEVYDCQVRKIYNRSYLFNTGGRNYMTTNGIQNLSKQERSELTIDGRETVIYDYVAFEVNIAYSLANARSVGDPYTKVVLEGYPPEMSREINKLALTILLNCAFDDNAAATIGFNLSKQYDIGKLHADGVIPDKVVPIRQLIIDLHKEHHHIEKYFYAGLDNELSNKGSDIVDYIMDFFVQRGEVILTVFDEIICPDHYENELIMVMGDAWEAVVGNRNNMSIRKEK